MHYRVTSLNHSRNRDDHNEFTNRRKSTTNRRRRKSKRNKSRKGFPFQRAIGAFLIISIVACMLILLVWSILKYEETTLASEKLKHRQLYERTYDQALHNHDPDTTNQLDGPTVVDLDDLDDWQNHWLASTYGKNVSECALTVLVMDPRLGSFKYGKGEALWFALESVAYSVPNACVLLLSTDCQNLDSKDSTIRRNVYSKSMPLFREMIRDTRVRLTFVDYRKYHLFSCSDFKNPSPAMMNKDFWIAEFLDEDSDLVLTIQDDSALCLPDTLESIVTHYRSFAFVGAPWPPVANSLIPFPSEGMCAGMPIRWHTWLLPLRKWRQAVKRGETGGMVEPNTSLNEKFPNICKNGQAPIGNGGMSIRSRDWMVKAINDCPHVKYSGVDTSTAGCKVLEDINEDFYFGVVLRGMGAPFPSALEASLFAVESLWPHEVLDVYGSTSKVRGISSSDHPDLNFENRLYTVPFGIHKAFWYYPNKLLRSQALHETCPFFKYVFSPSQSRWTAPE